jgi:hypothetical protein
MTVRFLIALSAITALCACESSTEPAAPPEVLEIVAGDAQVGTVGQTLSEPLLVRATDSQGRAVPDVAVLFAATTGEVSAAGSDSAAPSAVIRTDSLGEAAVRWTLGPVAGPQSASASVAGLPAVTFGATAEPGAAAGLRVLGGDGQLALPGEVLAESLAVRVVDEFGNAVGGAAVSWSVVAGGGTVSADTTVSDGSGATAAQETLGDSLGFHTVSAALEGGDPVAFNSLALSTVWPDPRDDAFSGQPGATRVDLIALGSVWSGDSLVVGLAAADSLEVGPGPGAAGFGGLLDFDVDRDSLTGIEAAADIYRPGPGSTGMGVDVFVDLFGDGAGRYIVFDSAQNVLALITPDVRGKVLRLAVPASVLGPGPLFMAVAVGTAAEPTDIAPNDSSFSVGASGGPAAGPMARPAPGPGRTTGRPWRPLWRRSRDGM